jgi:hypothetical protein
VGVIGMWAAAAVDPHQFCKVTSALLPLEADSSSAPSSSTKAAKNGG